MVRPSVLTIGSRRQLGLTVLTKVVAITAYGRRVDAGGHLFSITSRPQSEHGLPARAATNTTHRDRGARQPDVLVGRDVELERVKDGRQLVGIRRLDGVATVH